MKSLYKIIKNKKGGEARTLTSILLKILILVVVLIIIGLIAKRFLSPAPSRFSDLINKGMP
jgi:hypothetical protein|tara:strand:- start:318 stop:500 length:183 start_codon:yes stop_codon:yes gene_type:complete